MDTSSSDYSAKTDAEAKAKATAADEAANTKARIEAEAIINASTNSIENAIKKINVSPPKEYLVSIHEKMTELLNIMKEIKIWNNKYKILFKK